MTVIAISIATFVMTLLGGLFALYLQDRLHLILGFSAGAVIGVAFFDLVPESYHDHPTGWTTAATILGMAVVYGVVRLAEV